MQKKEATKQESKDKEQMNKKNNQEVIKKTRRYTIIYIYIINIQFYKYIYIYLINNNIYIQNWRFIKFIRKHYESSKNT